MVTATDFLHCDGYLLWQESDTITAHYNMVSRLVLLNHIVSLLVQPTSQWMLLLLFLLVSFKVLLVAITFALRRLNTVCRLAIILRVIIV